MKRLYLPMLLCLLATSPVFADTEDNVVFRTRMLPDNLVPPLATIPTVPPITAAGNQALATLTIHVNRDGRGNLSSATVTFDIDYTITTTQIFTALRIHNGAAGASGPAVIDVSLDRILALPGSGRVTRAVGFPAVAVSRVRGLLATPENYYVEIYSLTNPGGLMRGQLQATHLVLRPVLSPIFEVPAVPIDSEGAALIDVSLYRDDNGAITSGTVIFDVNYRFPIGTVMTLTGMHLHNARFGVNGPVVIDSDLNSTTRAVTVAGGTGNIFRIAEIPSTDKAGIAALTDLIADPTQFYFDLHTTGNPGGIMRGQLSRNVYVFFNTLNGAEETPPTNTGAIAYSMTYVRADRDFTGNIVSGAVSFNVNYNMNGGPVTLTGLHIHNGKFAVAGPVAFNAGTGEGAASVVSDSGVGSINRIVDIDSSFSNQVALDSLRGLIENPELYYVDLHTTDLPGGIIRQQLAQETYHFKTNMSPANEVPPITTANTFATGWITAKVNRDANGVIVGGTVTFDVNYVNDGPIPFTGLHIHYPGAAGINAPVVIDTGIGDRANSVDSPTGNGNITRAVTIDPTNATQIAALSTLISAPDNAYLDIHSTVFGDGVARAQMLPVLNVIPQVVFGMDRQFTNWVTTLTLSNPSATTAIQGTVSFFQSNGTPMPQTITDPNVGFLIPPSASITLSTGGAGAFTRGFARVFSNAALNIGTRFNSMLSPATTVTSRSVSLPVAVSVTERGIIGVNTGVALVASSAGTLTLSLRLPTGTVIAGGSRTIDVAASQQISSFVSELLPGISQTQYQGILSMTTSAGTISVLALQFEGSFTTPLTMTPVTVTAIP